MSKKNHHASLLATSGTAVSHSAIDETSDNPRLRPQKNTRAARRQQQQHTRLVLSMVRLSYAGTHSPEIRPFRQYDDHTREPRLYSTAS